MRIFVLAFALCLISFPALADCVDPVGVEGDLVYNAECKVPQYCNGTMWIALSDQSPCTPNTCSTDGLVGHWTLNETKGTVAADYSGNGHHGTLTDMDPATDWVAGKIGNALDFDGTNDHVNSGFGPAWNSGDDFTIALWFQYASTSHTSDKSLLGAYGASGQRVIIKVDGDGSNCADEAIRFFVRDTGASSSDAVCTSPITDTGWHHIVMVFETGGNITAYLDNTATSTPATGNSDGSKDLTGYPLYFGAVYAEPVALENFAGKLDDIRIYNRALSESEVSQLYNGGAGCE